jgi:hypothetical protein
LDAWQPKQVHIKAGREGPTYKLLKKVDKFQWTLDAQEALDALKKFLTTPPVLKPPHRATPSQPAEDLLLYISCTTHVVSTVNKKTSFSKALKLFIVNLHTYSTQGNHYTLLMKQST